MKIKTEAYSVYGELLPSAEYEAVSCFSCDQGPPEYPEPITLAVWVKDVGKTVKPIYLTPSWWQAIQQSAA